MVSGLPDEPDLDNASGGKEVRVCYPYAIGIRVFCFKISLLIRIKDK